MSIVQEIYNWAKANAYNIETQAGDKPIVIEFEELEYQFERTGGWLEKDVEKIYVEYHETEKKQNPLKQRLVAIWHILTNRNFILITGIKEFEKDGAKGRWLKTIRRTDYGGDSDYISCLGGAEMCKPKE